MRAWRVHDAGEPEDVLVLEDVPTRFGDAGDSAVTSPIVAGGMEEINSHPRRPGNIGRCLGTTPDPFTSHLTRNATGSIALSE